MKQKTTFKSLRLLQILVFGVLPVICCIISALVAPWVFKMNFETGTYDIEQITLSSDLDIDQLADAKVVFKPSDTIFCTVKTNGSEGIIGMHWFLGDELISEVIGKTQNNIISSYIKGNSPGGLQEGKYHVEIFTIKGQPIRNISFEVISDSSP